MAKNSVHHFSPLNQQEKLLQTLSDQLVKVQALTTVAMQDSFLDITPTTLHSYLWILHDIIQTAQHMSETALATTLGFI